MSADYLDRAASLQALSELLVKHARADRSTAMDGVRIARVDHPAQPSSSTTGSVLLLVVQGRKRLAVGARMYDCQAGQYVVAPTGLPVTGHFVDPTPRRPALVLGLSLRPAVIADLLLRANAPEVCSGHDEPAGLTVSTAPDELLDAVLRLVRLLDQPCDVKMLAPLVVDEILWRLISSDSNATVRRIAQANSTVDQVGHAVRWIREHYRKTFRVQELAQLSGMSISAFQRNFHTITGMTPIQFQKQIRLQNARLLLAAQAGNVSGVGRTVGYGSLSQFSREYRRQFGVAPAEDAVQLRELE